MATAEGPQRVYALVVLRLLLLYWSAFFTG